MKTWPLIIAIIVILALLCSPGLAISKSDLLSQYQTDSYIKPKIPSGSIVEPPIIPTTAPTQTPSGTGTGTLLVGANLDGAMVYLDGEYKGVTPGQHTPGAIQFTGPLELTVSAGSHQLKVTKEGYQDYTTSVIVIGGEETSVTAYLVPTSPPSWVVPTSIPTKTPTIVPTTAPTQVSLGTGTLKVTSIPTGAPVYLDGVYKGVTPITITGVSYGLHQLKVVAIKYGVPSNPYSTLVKVLNSTPVDVHVGQWSWSWWNGDQIS